ncbi:MAG: Cof-type HAD-IIB family hydrolase [Termitinemataceae bacterium]|nr:MAG: Cof-type HAD-IIB family hydrolase [Termitinemataceae bacterium]
MLKTKKAIFIDIDGTLIEGQKGPFNDDISAIQEARSIGNLVFINSGRSYANIPPHIINAGFFDGVICGAGSHVLIDGKTIYHKWINPHLLRLVCNYYFNSDKWCIFEGESKVLSINKINFSLMLGTAIDVKTIDEMFTKYKDELITKISSGSKFGGTLEKDEEKLLDEYFTVHVYDEYAEGILKGESKANGIKVVQKEINIDQKNIIAIGDSLNDMDMIEYAGVGVAMGNACGELKNMADFITADCGCGGVANAIKKFVM